jgi:hypothetical protein
MSLKRRQRDGLGNSGVLHQGVANGLALAIPLWAGIGIGFILLVLERPISEAESTVLMIAGACEFILLRHVLLRSAESRAPDSEPLARPVPATQRARPRRPILRQALTLSALAAAYLQYYYWDVQLQIASLNSVTVFVAAPAVG